jgi:hypothetical protein
MNTLAVGDSDGQDLRLKMAQKCEIPRPAFAGLPFMGFFL